MECYQFYTVNNSADVMFDINWFDFSFVIATNTYLLHLLVQVLRARIHLKNDCI